MNRVALLLATALLLLAGSPNVAAAEAGAIEVNVSVPLSAAGTAVDPLQRAIAAAERAAIEKWLQVRGASRSADRRQAARMVRFVEVVAQTVGADTMTLTAQVSFRDDGTIDPAPAGSPVNPVDAERVDDRPVVAGPPGAAPAEPTWTLVLPAVVNPERAELWNPRDPWIRLWTTNPAPRGGGRWIPAAGDDEDRAITANEDLMADPLNVMRALGRKYQAPAVAVASLRRDGGETVAVTWLTRDGACDKIELPLPPRQRDVERLAAAAHRQLVAGLRRDNGAPTRALCWDLVW